MPSGFDPTSTPGRQTTNVGVISAIFDGVRRPIAVTKGGADFNPETKYRAAEYDGRRHIAVGTDEIIEHGPSKMTGTFAEFPDRLLAALTPGGTVDGEVTTPLPAGTQITAGMLLEAPWHELTLRDGTIIRHGFDYGLVMPGNLNTKDKDEATVQLTIESRVDPTKPGYTTDSPDYFRQVIPGA